MFKENLADYEIPDLVRILATRGFDGGAGSIGQEYLLETLQSKKNG